MNGFRRKEIVKKSLYYASAGLTHLSGVGTLRARPAERGSLRVLMYHKVNDQRGNSLSVPISLFDEQMAFLKAHYRVISADELLGHVAGSAPLPPRAVLITFDDGYRDVLTHAYPILKRYGHPAVLFVSTDFIGGTSRFAHDRQFARFANAILNWKEVRALGEFLEIGSHAQSHRPLSRILPEEARCEIVASKAVIEERLGRPVRLFSYPKGTVLDFNRETREWVIEAGYRLCFTTIPKTNRPPLDPFALGRYNVEPYGHYYFMRLLEGSCDLMGFTATRWGAVLKRALVHQMGAATD
jgi:peptidoglycan/xylan/chitin deacetylase (PgdA/CDA1 family)